MAPIKLIIRVLFPMNVFTFLLHVNYFVSGRGIDGGDTNHRWASMIGSSRSNAPYQNFYVDQLGQHGNFSTIQSAIDSVPSNNTNWIIIHIKKGTYREKVMIPHEKRFIFLKGKGKNTEVVWDDHDTVIQSPTFTCLADNVVIKDISFRNSYNNPVNGNPRKPAVAAMVTGDKLYFYQVGFFGLQDTLWDDRGRHYFRKCTIQGAVDFIFGRGQSIYEDCSISVLGKALDAPSLPGYITAQGRIKPNDSNGFVFKNCKVFGTGSALLGRPWRGYARVLFYQCSFTDVVEPRGWDAWKYAGYENRLKFGEYDCHGPGAKTSHRVRWERNFSWDEVKQLTSMSFIDSADWLDTLPFFFSQFE